MWASFVERVREDPARFRAVVFALLVLASGFLPGLPVDVIDAAVAALLLFAVGEGRTRAVRARKRRAEGPEAL